MTTPSQSNLPNLQATRLKRSGDKRVVIGFKADPLTLRNIELLKASAAGITKHSLSYGILIRRALDFYADHLQNAFLSAIQGEAGEDAAAKLQRYTEFMKAEQEALMAAAGERRGREPGQKYPKKKKATAPAEAEAEEEEVAC